NGSTSPCGRVVALRRIGNTCETYAKNNYRQKPMHNTPSVFDSASFILKYYGQQSNLVQPAIVRTKIYELPTPSSQQRPQPPETPASERVSIRNADKTLRDCSDRA